MPNCLNKHGLIYKDRIDIVIGIEYVDFYENKYNTNFFTDLYIEYKRAFNGLHEDSCGLYKEGCHGKEQHIKRFNDLIENIKKVGVNTEVIPVIKYNNENWVINGFHRTSILNYYNMDININISNEKNTIISNKNITEYVFYPTDIYYFKNKKYDLIYCNYTMYNFLKYYNKEFSSIILFPNNKTLPTDLYNEIKKDIIYEIDIPLSNFKNNFKNNFIQLLYYNEEWCKNGGYINKSNACFNIEGNLKIYFIKLQNIDKLVNYKKKVRNYYSTGNNSIHTPDTQKENNELIQLLNNNTLMFMNVSPSLYIKYNNFNKLFNELKELCKNKNIDTRKICITSSSVLSVYGIRDCGDIDLFIDKKYIDIFKDTEFDNHNKYTIDNHYSKHFEDIIYNPNNHFYYQNFKFCNLSIILDYKKYRIQHQLYGIKSIEKDRKDIQEINKL